MLSLPISKDISAFEKAIEEKNIGKIIGCIEIWFAKYNDANIVAYKEDLKNEAKNEYEQTIVRYESLVKDGVAILNCYVAENCNGFSHLVVDGRKLFLKVVKTLIDTNSLDMGFMDKDELCNILLQFLSSASKPDENIFVKTNKLLTTEIESSDKDEDGNPIKIIWAASALGNMEFLSRLLRESYGRNYKVLKEIFIRIKNMPSSDEIDNKLYCSLMDIECNKFIPAGNFYFIAFPFSEQGIEDKIIGAFKKKFPLEPKIARGILENRTALCQICEFILSSKFGVYVLNKYSLDSLNRHLPNPNVTLELGLTLGHKRPYIMLVEKGTAIISDLGGYLRIEYDNIDDIPAKIEEHNFANFYYEGM